jgi:hypothetical protein
MYYTHTHTYKKLKNICDPSATSARLNYRPEPCRVYGCLFLSVPPPRPTRGGGGLLLFSLTKKIQCFKLQMEFTKADYSVGGTTAVTSRREYILQRNNQTKSQLN